jgi:hypothetical protein
MRKRIICLFAVLVVMIGSASAAAVDITYDGTNHTPTVTQAETDTIKMSAGDWYVTYYKDGQETTTFTDVGSYKAVVTITNSNFTTADTTVDTFKIVAATITIDVSNVSCTYDGQAHKATATLTSTGYSAAEGTDYKLYYVDTDGNSTDSVINAGTYTIKIKLLNSNLSIGSDTVGTYTVHPKTAALTWAGNETRAYNGSPSNVAASVSNLVSGDSCSVTVTGGSETNVGTYTAVASALGNGNYALSTENTVSYTIALAQVNFDVSNTTAFYDGQPHTATVTQASGDPTQMSAGDYTISYRDSNGVSHSSVSDVGTYEIIASITNSNFTTTQTDLGTFTISYAPATTDMVTLPDNYSSDTWYNSDLTFKAGDGYQISKTPSSGYGSSIVVSDESTASGSSISFYSMSSTVSDGKVYTGTISYKLDKTPPVINAVTGIPSGWQNTNTTISVNATDTLSGIDKYSFDGGHTWQTSNTSAISSYASLPAGTIQVRDVAGNITSYASAIELKIDHTAPTVTWDTATEALANYRWHSSVVLSGSATDAQSGVATISAELDTGSGTTSTVANGYKITSAGTYSVILQAVDNAGNSGSSYALTFLVDPIISDLCTRVGTLNATTSSLDEVLAVLNWYNALSSDQQSHIQNSDEGAAAYALLQQYWDAAQNRAVQEIKNIIAAGGPTKADIEHAIDLYDKLDDAHKALIDLTAYADLLDKRDAMSVEDLINLIPDHPLSPTCSDLDYHKSTIESAVIAYEALSSSARAYVNADKVSFMREQYSLLLSLLGYTNKAGSVEVIGLVERVAATSGSTISVEVEQVSNQVVSNQAIAYNVTLVEKAADGTTTEVQPVNGETVTVKLKLDNNVETNTVQIYHVMDDGTKELIGTNQNLHFVTENGSTFAIFNASHFSIYAVSATVTPTTVYYYTTYRLTGTAGEGGTISPSAVTITRGESKTFTIQPDAGYQVSDVLLDGKSVLDAVKFATDGSATCTLSDIRADHALSVSFTPAVPTFTDIEGHWAYDSIMNVVKKGLMNGVSDTKFDPDGKVTRAMVVTTLWRLAGSPAAVTTNNYSDVPDSQWYSEAISWATAKGIVKGYPDGSFVPGGEISRQELALIVYRYLAHDDSRQWTDFTFADADKIASWAKNGVGWCLDSGIMQGEPGNMIAPEDHATRAQLAVVLTRLIEYQK